ncbi:MAG: hypothetical protein IBX64_10010 [Actinobacteria bacterium]|nr:hypothetical protein [Actinomycetota bacterium]
MKRLLGVPKWLTVKLWANRIWILIIALAVSNGYLYWQHQEDEKSTIKAFKAIVKDIDRIDGNIGTLADNLPDEFDPSEIISRLDDLESSISNVESEVSDAQSTADSAESEASDAKREIDDLKFQLSLKHIQIY